MLVVQPATLVRVGAVLQSKSLRAAVAPRVSRLALARLKMMVSWQMRGPQHEHALCCRVEGAYVGRMRSGAQHEGHET